MLRVANATAAAFLILAASVARAQEEPAEEEDHIPIVELRPPPPRVTRGARIIYENPAWPTVEPVEFIPGLVAGAIAITDQILGPQREPWRGGYWIDEDVRGSLRAPTQWGRDFARDLSDVFLAIAVSYPIVVDGLLVAAWYRGDGDAAGHLMLISAETLLITAAIQSTTIVFAARERPYGRHCGAVGGDADDQLSPTTRDCDSDNRFYSFFSGHTSQAFASAALTCVNHMRLGLHDDETVDVLECGAGFAFATATGVLRIVGDEHYTTDVLTGAAIGTAVGFLAPLLLHGHPGRVHGDHRHQDDEAARRRANEVSWIVLPAPNGVTAVGAFP